MKVLLKLNSLAADKHVMVYDAQISPLAVSGIRCEYLCSGHILVGVSFARGQIAEMSTVHDAAWPEMTEEDEDVQRKEDQHATNEAHSKEDQAN
jgi:hypothetical protein